MNYDTALITQIVKDKQSTEVMLDRVVHALVPLASEGTEAHKDEAWVEVRKIAQGVVEELFITGQIDCPKCGADILDAENLCWVDGDCPVTVGG